MPTEPSQKGFVFAATGPDYDAMARCAARSLRLAMPEAAVDLFTDQPTRDPVFDTVVELNRTWFRPKMEALLRSRFERTVFLDADIIVRHDISELFDVLQRFDITGAQMIRTNQGVNLHDATPSAPTCFPQINSGVLGVRRNERTTALLEKWETTVRESGARFDQPILRDLLWQGNVNTHVLPSQYNMMSHRMIRHWDSSMPSPRVLHLGGLGAPFDGDPTRAYDVPLLIGNRMFRHLQRLDAADASLGGDPARVHPPLCAQDVLNLREELGNRVRSFSTRGRRKLKRLVSGTDD